MSIWRSLDVALFLFFCMAFTSAVHGVTFSRGRAMLKRRVLIRHPKNVIISFNPPLAIIFQIETGSGRLISSIKFVRGWKIRNRAMTTTWTARATIFQLMGESMSARMSHRVCSPLCRRGWMVPASHLLPLLGHILRLIGVSWIVGDHLRKGMGGNGGPSNQNRIGRLLSRTPSWMWCRILLGLGLNQRVNG